jgi:hypothetical protein
MRRFDSGFGALEYDNDYLSYEIDVFDAMQQSLGALGKLGINRMMKVAAKAMAVPKTSRGKIPLEQIDNIRYVVFDKGYALTNLVMNPNFGAQISFVTASGGFNGTVSLYVKKGLEAEAESYISELRNITQNRGRKVEILAEANSDMMKICPDCAEQVKDAARKCRFCGFLFA